VVQHESSLSSERDKAMPEEFNSKMVDMGGVLTKFMSKQPRIPTFGPASQLSAKTLISAAVKAPWSDSKRLDLHVPAPAPVLPSLAELGIASSPHERLDVVNSLHQASTPLSARRALRKGLGISPGRKAAKSCEPRLRASGAEEESFQQGTGLRSALFKGDHTHRLPAYAVDVDETQANEDATPSPSCKPNASQPDFYEQATEQAESQSASLAPPRLERSVAGPVCSKQTEASRAYAKVGEASWRYACLLASFYLKESEISAALCELERYQDTQEMELGQRKEIPK
jgi:hypothetical protein